MADCETSQTDRRVNGGRAVAVRLDVSGRPSVAQLTEVLSELDGVLEVSSDDTS